MFGLYLRRCCGVDGAGPLNVGSATSFTATSAALTNGFEYRIDVRCRDAFNRLSNWLSSDGVRVITSRSITFDAGSGNAANASVKSSTINYQQPSQANTSVLFHVFPHVVSDLSVEVNYSTFQTTVGDATQWYQQYQSCFDEQNCVPSDLSQSWNCSGCILSSLCVAGCHGFNTSDKTCVPVNTTQFPPQSGYEYVAGL